MFRDHRFLVAVALVLAPHPVAHATRLAAAEPLDTVIYTSPAVPMPRVEKTFPPRLLELWLQALERPEADLRGQAAQSIAAAHGRGMPGLSAAVPRLTRAVVIGGPGIGLAAARALVALDAREAAATLWQAAQADPELREAVEPALAAWKYADAAPTWRDRLAKPADRRSFTLAVRGLAALRDEQALPRLREVALAADALPAHRLEAARALAAIRAEGWEADARTVAADASPRGIVGRVVGASLLRSATGDAAVAQLQAFARDAEPAVAVAAVARLGELDPKHVLAVLAAVTASPDPTVRAAGVEALLKAPSVEHVRAIGDRLADAHPDVRAKARRALVELAARPDLRAAVLARGTAALATDEWRSQEQAALLLGQLGHTPAAPRLVELLAAPRPEAFVAAAWAVRVLAVRETLPAVLAHVRDRHRRLTASGPTAGLRGATGDDVDRHLTQLVQFVGQADYRPADDALRALVPRVIRGGMPPVFTPVGPETRAAAVWALGRFHENDPEEALVELVEPRLTGDGSLGPDDERVRRMAAVALGRMKSKSSLEALVLYSDGDRPTPDGVTNAVRWAAAAVQGKPPPSPGVFEVPQRDWFVVPLR